MNEQTLRTSSTSQELSRHGLPNSLMKQERNARLIRLESGSTKSSDHRHASQNTRSSQPKARFFHPLVSYASREA